MNYLKVVLKKEKLSEEAEAKRFKYEMILNSLEQGLQSSGRPLSIVCDDDSGYFSVNRNRGLIVVFYNTFTLNFIFHGFLFLHVHNVLWY